MTRPEARRLLQEQGRQRDESTSSPVPESPESPESAESPLSPCVTQATEQVIQVTEMLRTRQAIEADGGDSTSSFQMVEDLVEYSTESPSLAC